MLVELKLYASLLLLINSHYKDITEWPQNWYNWHNFWNAL